MTTTARKPTTMAPRHPRNRPAVVLSAALVAAFTLSACGASSTATSGTAPASAAAPAASTTPSATGAVLASASTALGTILVDGQGRTVYLFAADSPGHSSCTGTCLQYWPIVPAPASLPGSLAGVTAQLGVLTRPDGSKQLTVGGWPVYTYAGDTAPGSTSGEGKNLSGGLWWVLSAGGSPVKTSSAPNVSPTPSGSPSTSKSSGGGGWA